MDVIAALGRELPKLVLALPILGGLWALRRLGTPAAVERGDRRAAFTLGTALAGIGWSGGTFLFGMLSGMFGNQPNWAWAAVLGVAVAALVFGSALFGYAIVRGRGGRAGAFAGAIAAPILLLGGPLWLAGQLNMIASRSYEEAEAAKEAERSAFLHVTASVVSVTRATGAAGPASVRLLVTVRSDREFALFADPTTPSPFFSMMRRDPVVYAGADAPAGSPVRYEAGTEVRYEVAMSIREPDSAIRGPWTLTLNVAGADGLRYLVRVPVELPAPAPA